MNDFDNSLPHLGKLLELRLAVVGQLAESMEASRLAIVSNDAEAIARGAAHQAELCRQWSRMEDHLRRQAGRVRDRTSPGVRADMPEAAHSAQLAAEWQKLSTRIRYLTRVHSSLLRHMQRSLAVWNHLILSCEPTYRPVPDLGSTPSSLRAGE